jgi:cell division septation protein DedD
MATSDDGREIHLSGKQLVFLFMAVTVVSVVIFLCGVLVGRGVQSRVTAVEAAAPAPDDAGEPVVEAPPAANASEPTKAADLGYQQRLESAGPVPEKLVPREAPPSGSRPPAAKGAEALPSSAPPPAPAPSRPAGPTAPAPAAASAPGVAATPADLEPVPPEPRGDGFAIQVAALRGRGEAEAVVSRLKEKGYSAYLMPPLAGQPSVFRVRVGKFKARAEAERVATRLEREEQFKPWITR